VVDLAAVEHGGCVVACNDMFFGSRHNLIMPGRSLNMGDGWETKRSRKEAPDWLLLRLAAEGVVETIEVDTNHFKGNFPESCAIEGKIAKATTTPGELVENEASWKPVLSRTKLQAHTRHFYSKELDHRGPFTHLRLRIFPDGGVSRLRVHGVVSTIGRENAVFFALNALPEDALRATLLGCCGSLRWVHAMVKARPYDSLFSLQKKSEAAFGKLKDDDWLEAFLAHPRIGEKKAAQATGTQAASWSKGEQAGVAEADDRTLGGIAKANAAYEKKFGHIYIVCATGKSPAELLQIAEDRLKNDAKTELARAAAEQKNITALRLEKLAHWKG
ncbi:MAG: 2-oxo-4-hydroxy-4-carboxy-5-ureidoimidazoline decarboxylase, partial [Polyangiaceae bacterium]